MTESTEIPPKAPTPTSIYKDTSEEQSTETATTRSTVMTSASVETTPEVFAVSSQTDDEGSGQTPPDIFTTTTHTPHYETSSSHLPRAGFGDLTSEISAQPITVTTSISATSSADLHITTTHPPIGSTVAKETESMKTETSTGHTEQTEETLISEKTSVVPIIDASEKLFTSTEETSSEPHTTEVVTSGSLGASVTDVPNEETTSSEFLSVLPSTDKPATTSSILTTEESSGYFPSETSSEQSIPTTVPLSSIPPSEEGFHAHTTDTFTQDSIKKI